MGLTIFLSYIHIYNKALYMKLNKLKQIIKEEFLNEIKVLSAGSYGINHANESIPLKIDSNGELKIKPFGFKEIVFSGADLKILRISSMLGNFEEDEEDYDDGIADVVIKRNTTLTKITFKHCPNLKKLNCVMTKITSLDLSNCPNLEEIYCCNNNKLTNLNVSNCTKLVSLNCRSNKLTSLDVSNCTKLEYLSCGQNLLTSLDLSNCPNLKDHIYTDGNVQIIKNKSL